MINGPISASNFTITADSMLAAANIVVAQTFNLTAGTVQIVNPLRGRTVLIDATNAIIASTVSVDGGGYYGADAKGNGLGPGGGLTGSPCGGAGHGGSGGAAGSVAYGSTTNPALWGSAGCRNTGGAGGGMISIRAQQVIDLTGNLSANGLDGVSGGGGGSGGSIYISCEAFITDSLSFITANGGKGSQQGSTTGGGGIPTRCRLIN